MSEFDANASYYLKTYILPLILALSVVVLVSKKQRKFRHWLFALLHSRLSKTYHAKMDSTKVELFKDLPDFVSLDRDLRNKGVIRILEVGVGPGSNFKFYPKNARFVALDPNPYFPQYLEENKSKFPNIHLEKFILGGAEDMKDIPDGSIDVVITTIVLCSVRDVKTVLKEIKRVLAPGGKYYFLEHQYAEEGSWRRPLQNCVNLIWPVLCDGCNITREVSKMIKKSGFSKVNLRNFDAPMPKIVSPLVSSHTCGFAIK